MARRFEREGYRGRSLGVRGGDGGHGSPQISRRQVRGIIVIVLVAIVLLALSAQFLSKTAEFAAQTTQFAKAEVLSTRYEMMEDGQEQCRIELLVHVNWRSDVRAHVYVARRDGSKFLTGGEIDVTYRWNKTGGGIEIRRVTVPTTGK